MEPRGAHVAIPLQGGALVIIDRFLKQAAVLKRSTGVNAYGEQQHATGVSVPVRWLQENTMVRNDEGVDITSTAHVSVTEAITTEDLVTDENGRDREVVMVRKDLDVYGRFSHFVAYLK